MTTTVPDAPAQTPERARIQDALREALRTLPGTDQPALDHLTDAVMDAMADLLDTARQRWFDALFTPTREWIDTRPAPQWPAPADAMPLVRVQELTRRERELMTHIVRDASVRDAAAAMGITRATARTHLSSVHSKLGVRSQRQAAILLIRYGFVDVHTGVWDPAITTRTTPA